MAHCWLICARLKELMGRRNWKTFCFATAVFHLCAASSLCIFPTQVHVNLDPTGWVFNPFSHQCHFQKCAALTPGLETRWWAANMQETWCSLVLCWSVIVLCFHLCLFSFSLSCLFTYWWPTMFSSIVAVPAYSIGHLCASSPHRCV